MSGLQRPVEQRAARPLGVRRPLGGKGRALWFLGSGAAAGLLQLGLLGLLVETTELGAFSNALAFLLAAQVNFLLNHRLTWGDRQRGGIVLWFRQLAGFNALMLAGAAVNQAIYLAIEPAMPYLLAGGLALISTTLLKYLVADRFIFQKLGAQPN